MSPWGEVESGWEKTEDKVRFTVKIPSNCTAEIVLPDGRREEVKTGDYCYE